LVSLDGFGSCFGYSARWVICYAGEPSCRRSWVDLSRLSSAACARANPARSERAPLAVSRKTFSTPASRNCFTCASTPSVDTRIAVNRDRHSRYRGAWSEDASPGNSGWRAIRGTWQLSLPPQEFASRILFSMLAKCMRQRKSENAFQRDGGGPGASGGPGST
jgi:hypothetical protein